MIGSDAASGIVVNASVAASLGAVSGYVSIFRYASLFSHETLLGVANAAGGFGDGAYVVSTGPGPVTVRLDNPITSHSSKLRGIVAMGHITPYFSINGMKVSSGDTIQINPGDRVSIEGYLQLTLFNDSSSPRPIPTVGFTNATDFAELDASHTARFFLDVLTPGAYLVTDSGHNYSSSTNTVPEPTTYLTTALSLSALCVTMIRHSKR
jgi:hypothetical protein